MKFNKWRKQKGLTVLQAGRERERELASKRFIPLVIWHVYKSTNEGTEDSKVRLGDKQTIGLHGRAGKRISEWLFCTHERQEGGREERKRARCDWATTGQGEDKSCMEARAQSRIIGDILITVHRMQESKINI